MAARCSPVAAPRAAPFFPLKFVPRAVSRLLSIHILKKRAEFLRLNRGKKHVMPYAIFRFAPAVAPVVGVCRVGFTVTSKCGNAVVRNRIKRRLRAVVRAVFPTEAKEGMEYVIIARAEVANALCEDSYAAIEKSFLQALEKIHAGKERDA